MKTLSRRGASSTAARLGACVLAVTLAGAAGAAPAEASAVELHDGVLVTPDTGAVYLMTPDGGIDALDLDNGNVVWRTREAARPLLIDGTTLVAQAEPSRSGEMSIAVFDLLGSGVPEHRARVELPTHVRAQVTESLRTSFAARAEKVGDRVELSWKSETRPAKGISPLVREDLDGPTDGKSIRVRKARPTSLVDGGAAVLDLSSGRVEATPAGKSATTAAKGPILIELSPAERLQGINGRQFLSLDGRHVLASVRGETGQLRTRHQWTLFDRATGEQIGEAGLPVSARPFVVRGNTLVLVTPPHTYQTDRDWAVEAFTVRGIDLLSGAERWKQEVRDAGYGGPVPH